MEPVMKHCYPFVGTGQCPVPTSGWDEIENDGCENIKNKLFFKMQTQNQKQIKTRKRNRLRGYDYSQNGWYFVTICIKDKVKYLGEIKNEKMEYSQYGEIILKFWQEIRNIIKNVFLDERSIIKNCKIIQRNFNKNNS